MPIPERHVLLTSQRNQIFTALQSKGLNPEEFTFYEEDSTAHLNHRSAQYGCRISVGSFTVSGSMGALEIYTVPYRVICSPGSEQLQEKRYFRSWSEVINSFNNWLTRLTFELQTPDLWATFLSDTELIRWADDKDNEPFTVEEQVQVKKALNEIKSYLIKTHDLSGIRLEKIEKQLSYLEESATRMGRKDWLHVSIGVLVNIATSVALGGDGTRELFQFAGQIFKQLLGTVLYLAGPH